MKVSAVLYKCTYCIFTLYGSMMADMVLVLLLITWHRQIQNDCHTIWCYSYNSNQIFQFTFIPFQIQMQMETESESFIIHFFVFFLHQLIYQVCREFQRGNCSRGEQECKFAHPNEQTTIDNTDNTVTVCMDYIKGRCTREKCKYFHPPPHLQAKIKAAQHQANQASVVPAVVSWSSS